MIDIDDLERKHAAATPGEWEAAAAGMHATVSSQDDLLVVETYAYPNPIADAVAIVALHNAFPALAAELRTSRTRLEAVLATLTAEECLCSPDEAEAASDPCLACRVHTAIGAPR